MASYDEMKEAARREALGEQASKFYEMTRTPRMFQTAGEVAPPPSRDPLAGLPVDPERAASLDARYAEVDRHLAAATAARARIPKGAEVEGPGDSSGDDGDELAAPPRPAAAASLPCQSSGARGGSGPALPCAVRGVGRRGAR